MDATSTMDAMRTAVYEYRIYFAYISVPIIMLGLVIRCLMAQDPSDYVKQVSIIAITVLLMAYYPAIFKMLISACLSGKDVADAVTAEELWKRFKDPKIIGADSRWNFGAQIASIFYGMTWCIGYVTKSVMQFFQALLASLMIAVSPLVVAWMALPSTASTTYRFFTTTFAVAVWSLSLSLADKFLLAMFDYIFSCLNKVDLSVSAVGATDVTAVYYSAQFAILLGIVLVLCSVFVYVVVPLLVFNFVRGDNITGSMHTAMRAASAVAGGVSSAASAAIKGAIPAGEMIGAMVQGAKSGMAAAASSRPSDGITSQPGPKQSASEAAIKGAAQGAAGYAKKVFDALQSKHGFNKKG